LRGGLELIRPEVLLAHHQDMMIGEGAAQGGEVFRIDRRGEVETDDFGAGVIRQRRDGEGRHLDRSFCEKLPPGR